MFEDKTKEILRSSKGRLERTLLPISAGMSGTVFLRRRLTYCSTPRTCAELVVVATPLGYIAPVRLLFFVFAVRLLLFVFAEISSFIFAPIFASYIYMIRTSPSVTVRDASTAGFETDGASEGPRNSISILLCSSSKPSRLREV